MPVVDPQIVQLRLEEFRRNLLDTSLKNRLINFRTRTKSGKPLEKVVEVFGEDPVELVRILVTDGKAMSFTGRPDPKPSKKDQGQLTIVDTGQEVAIADPGEAIEQEMEAFLATGTEAVDTTDLKLNTRDMISSLLRKLTKIARDAKVAIEEQGVNVLFIALGSLDWYESDVSNEIRRAPLIMIPVALERTNAGAFRLRWDGTDLGANLSIAAKLKAEYGIRMPDVPDVLDIATYFDEVEKSIGAQSRWSIDRTAVALAFFSYAKYLMYRDLDPAGWPDGGKPMDHETLGAMLHSGFDETEPGIGEDDFLDPFRAAADVCEVYDADGSQTLAILEANTGRTMIIEGPPGTGKSQTITNLIAEAIGAGKKVLFVAEKAAALDVVFRRLREANLEDACLELHSHKANKRSFYAELKRTVSVAAPRTARAEADLKRMEEAKSLLNGYSEAVNVTLDPFEIAPRYAMGKLVTLGVEPAPEGRHDFLPMDGWSETIFQESLDAVGRLQTQVALMGRPVDHPYYGCTLDHLLPVDKEDIARRLGEAGQAAEKFHISANALAEALRVELPVRPADIERLRECASFVSHAPDVTGVAIREDWKTLEPVVREAIVLGQQLIGKLDVLGPYLGPNSLDIPTELMIERLRFDQLRGEISVDGKALDALDRAAATTYALSDLCAELARLLDCPEVISLSDVDLLSKAVGMVAHAPDVSGTAIRDGNWEAAEGELRHSISWGVRFARALGRTEKTISPQHLETEVEALSRTLRLAPLTRSKVDVPELVEDAVHKAARTSDLALELAHTMGYDEPDSLGEVETLIAIAKRISTAPDLRGVAVTNDGWATSRDLIREALETTRKIQGARSRYGSELTEAAWGAEVQRELAIIEAQAGSLFRFLNSGFRQAMISSASYFKHPSKSPSERIGALRAIAEVRDAESVLARHRGKLSALFGLRWKAAGSNVDELTEIASWVEELYDAVGARAIPQQALSVFDRIPDTNRIGSDAEKLKLEGAGANLAIGRLGTAIGLKAEARERIYTFLKSDVRIASDQASQITTKPLSLRDTLEAFDALIELQAARAELRSTTVENTLGTKWKGESTDWENAEAILNYALEVREEVRRGELPSKLLDFLSSDKFSERTPDAFERYGHNLSSLRAAANSALTQLRTEIFGVSADERADIENEFAYVIKELRPILGSLKAALPRAEELGFRRCLALLETLNDAQVLRAKVRTSPNVLGTWWKAEETVWDEAEVVLDWIVRLHDSIRKGRLPQGLLAFFAEECPRIGLDEAVRCAQSDRLAAQDSIRIVLELAQLDRDPTTFTEQPIAAQRERIALWTERLDDLPALIRYNAVAGEVTKFGLTESVTLANSWTAAGARLAEAFERSWYTGVVRKAVRTHTVLARFERRSHEETAEEFRRLDDLSLRYNRAKVALAHWRTVPRGVAGGAMGWLGIQFGLKQNHRPIRMTMEKAGEAVQAIKPVFLMSPLSVAMHLPATGPRFDVVIFDEASQVKPEDAFGGILRARQTIVVGDSKQMPPTSFFDKLTSEELDDEDSVDESGVTELESVLAMMSAKLPAKSPRRRDLRWHYRSRHDALIATSNRLFYEDRLVVFPSPWRGGANGGLVLRHDPTTVYGRGGSRKNVEEARAVARAAKRHVLQHPKLTLGIAAFSKAQQEAIQDELDILRRDEPAFANFDSEHPFEPLFVKNLENVQGDERDVILISVGYGRDENGFIPASFGPLNRDGGERRLNVLITRARVRCEVFTNLKAGDMRLTESPSRGVLALRTFLAFADTGSLDVPSITGMEPQSPFEEAVLDRLRSHGFDVEPQVGSCGFYIDMAVRHPEQPQRFVLGIECDGAMYHSARTARDRDKLRQQVLEDRGWRIHRIWSTDWFNNADKEFDRLVHAIAAATARTSEDIAEESARPSEYVELERDSDQAIDEGVEPYILSGLRIDLRGIQLHQVAPSQLADWVVAVTEVESPVHVEEIVRRVREGAGIGRAGNRIKEAVEMACSYAERQGRLSIRGEFVHLPSQESVPVRTRSGLPPSAKRLEMVSPEEATEALARVIRRSFGIESGEAAYLTARSLGFDRTTTGMADRLRMLIDQGIKDGVFENDEGLLRIPAPPTILS